MRASGYDRVDNDFYVEPKSCVEALLDAESFRGLCWDPACGGGTIPKAMTERGLQCFGSDVVDRGYGEVRDFFEISLGITPKVASIVSNPPFGVIEAFIHHALSLTTDKVVVLARLALLEGIQRREMFRSVPFARMWVSSRRLSMPPGGSTIEAKGGAIAYSWYVFKHGHTGPATVGWLDG